jgi:hypothetical protein
VVWRRDEGRCTFVSERGQTCGETSFLEFRHDEEANGAGAYRGSGARAPTVVRGEAAPDATLSRGLGQAFGAEERSRADEADFRLTLLEVTLRGGQRVFGLGGRGGGDGGYG